MNLIIVGHGPSLKGQNKGSLIDSYDYVVRLKNCGPLIEKTPEDYGHRVDALCMSTEVSGLPELVIAGMYWFYPKFGQYDELATLDVITRRGAPFMIPLDLMNYWNQKFREMGSSHPVVSTGMAAIIIAAHYHEPKAITLAGFDTLMDPDKEFTRNMDAPRTGSGPYVHDFHTENRLLDILKETYSFDLWSL